MRAVMLISLIWLTGCVGSPGSGNNINGFDDNSIGATAIAAPLIVGNCNIAVSVVNSRNTNVNNALQCSDPRDKSVLDGQYCHKESYTQYVAMYPKGLLTLPLFPLFLIGNYVSGKVAESEANKAYASCMVGLGHIENGYGVYTFSNGNIYQGYWKDFAFNGKGVLTFNEGGKYDGEWKDGLRSGEGYNVYTDGVIYKGTFANNMRNGYGAMAWSDGRHFEGVFRDDRPDGRGVFTAADGTRYEGDWTNGCLKLPGTTTAINQDLSYCSQ